MCRRRTSQVDDTAAAVRHLERHTITEHAATDHFDVPTGRLQHFASSLRELGATRDVDELLQLAVDLASELIDGCDVADIMFARDGHTTVPAATDPISRRLAEAQQRAGSGPCLAVFDHDEVVLAADLPSDDRWPEFGREAAELGITSALAFRLFVHRNHEDRFGALNLYGRDGRLDADSIELGSVFAAFCSAALLNAIKEQGLKTALESRDVIGQAKGVLMERHRITADEAYGLLREQSQQTNTKVVELAEYVTSTGELP